MKIIYILPSLTIRGSSVIFEHAKGLSKKHDVIITSLDEFQGNFPINPLKIDEAKKEFADADVIIGYNPVCAFYVNDIETKARKYYLLFSDEHEYFTKEYIQHINKVSGVRLDIEFDKQHKFIDASYNLPLHFIVPNKKLEAVLTKNKQKVSLLPIGVNEENFYIDQYIPKGSVLRIINDGNDFPWNGTEIFNRAISELHGFELWTLGDNVKMKSDKKWGNLKDEMLRKVFSSADIFVNTLEVDGTAEMSLKAMMCGCAVITRMTSGGEMVYQDGQNCIIIKGDTKEELAESLKTSLQELMTDKEKLETIVRGGLTTPKPYDIDNLEKILKRK